VLRNALLFLGVLVPIGIHDGMFWESFVEAIFCKNNTKLRQFSLSVARLFCNSWTEYAIKSTFILLHGSMDLNIKPKKTLNGDKFTMR
jgi:hypothetical protein